MSTTSKPTAAQATVLAHIATGNVYRWEHSGTWYIVGTDGAALNKTAVSSVLRRGWAEYGELDGIRRPLALTDAGHAIVAVTQT